MEIKENAFYSFNNLEYLEISQTSLNEFKVRFQNSKSKKKLVISLKNNSFLKDFNPNTFGTINRSVEIILGSNALYHGINYLDENVFEPIILKNHQNIINLNNFPLNCSNCRNKWLLKYNCLDNFPIFFCRHISAHILSFK